MFVVFVVSVVSVVLVVVIHTCRQRGGLLLWFTGRNNQLNSQTEVYLNYLCTINITSMEAKKLNRSKGFPAEKMLTNRRLSENPDARIRIPEVLCAKVAEQVRTGEVQPEA